MLQLKEIKKDYVTASETVQALKGVSISFRQKEFVSILGPSGCGKTTLLNIIGGLDHYTSGDLIIGGRSTKSYTDRDWDVYRNHRIGFIFQSYNLIPHQTVLGNVELALTISGVSREERTRRAKIALDRVGLANQYYKKPNQLSGGQCQRVAIARALVNDPEILLADEPTGALDTVTSVQIMDLIKEISGERLVIMVTHNPEIADKYSTRIIRLLDGNVIEDTNPFASEDEEKECAERAKIESEKLEEELSIAKTPKERKKLAKKKKERAKMSFFTAFMLSAKNLISKKGRTAMVGFAGSIGIIGIAMVLAFSAGIKGYVASMQDDMLSGNPIQITETTYDLDALMGMMSPEDTKEILKEEGKVYINSIIKYLAKMEKDVDSLIIQNDISAEYIDYLKTMPKNAYAAMLMDYGIDLSNNIYTDFYETNASAPINYSISALTTVYTSILSKTDFSNYASYATSIVPSFKQLPTPNSENTESPNYISDQYDVWGEIADEKGEIVLVLDRDDMLSDILLARLGYYDQDEFLKIIDEVTDGKDYYPDAVYREYFTHEELLGKTFTWYPNNTVFDISTLTTPMGDQTKITYHPTSESFSKDDGIELRVVGILSPKENISFGSLSTGIYYTEDLTNHVLESSKDSEIVKHITDNGDITSMFYGTMAMGISYSFKYSYNGETYDGTALLGSQIGLSDMMGGMAGGGTGGGTGGAGGSVDMSTLSGMRILSLRAVGGASTPNSISIYPQSFSAKDIVTKYLDGWNSDLPIMIGDKEISGEGRADVTYMDTLSLIIDMINTMIDVVKYGLVAFTSVSLVVSTVMIGIITYVSVVERIKEIGVIRALGGRKKDVSHLFNAETFIIGLLAGAFGIAFTYLASFIVNLILKPLIGYSRIAALPLDEALLLVALSILLTLISGLIPASNAAKRDPVVALRTE